MEEEGGWEVCDGAEDAGGAAGWRDCCGVEAWSSVSESSESSSQAMLSFVVSVAPGVWVVSMLCSPGAVLEGKIERGLTFQ